jgi:hypothetical protein
MLWFGLVSAGYGQFETAAVLGTALDPNGGAIPKARISLQNLDTGTEQTTVADALGDYQFLEVHLA